MDRGGTFTDVVACAPSGEVHTAKTLSDSHTGGMQVIRHMLGLPAGAKIPLRLVAEIRIGMTISTNLLLERKGQRTALLVTRGFADALAIGDQTRPHLFSLNTHRPPPLYAEVIEIEERMDANGKCVQALDEAQTRAALNRLRQKGFECIAIAFMHAVQNPKHEKRAAALARACGFTTIICSSEISSLIKYIPRASTAVAEAYLASGVRDYVSALRRQCDNKIKLLFMQSNGVLAEAAHLNAVNTILSGPAGGIVGMDKCSQQAGFARAIGFDMGGTSTDISISGHDSLRLENTINDIPLFVPMLDIHTIAAGGGSMLRFENQRLQVGPQSAGAAPGPACYGMGGALTITDCNVMLGRLRPAYFPRVFGRNHDEPLNANIVRRRFAALAKKTNLSAVQLAESFLQIATENIAHAIRRLAITRGVNLNECVLNAFGGAGGQHACAVADALSANTILIQRQSSTLSAVGIGVSDIGVIKNQSVEKPLAEVNFLPLFKKLEAAARQQLPKHTAAAVRRESNVHCDKIVRCRYERVSAHLPVAWQPNAAAMRKEFEKQHRAIFGYHAPQKQVLCAIVEVALTIPQSLESLHNVSDDAARGNATTAPQEQVIFNGKPTPTPFYHWNAMPKKVSAPAVIYDDHNTILVAPTWSAQQNKHGDIILKKNRAQATAAKTHASTIATNQKRQHSEAALTEIMNSRFTFVAEKMGEMLRHIAMSVNIRDRLDFSCAVFDRRGNLVANAPHIPVHLGSMSECVRHLHRTRPDGLLRGDVFLLNAPHHGGTHLPDLTVVQAGFLNNASDSKNGEADFYLAARGHHADIGGIAPGSMPANSKHINDEGVLFDAMRIVKNNNFLENEIRRALTTAPHPARAPDENIADLRAQVAALAAGMQEMQTAAASLGAPLVRRYLQAVQSNAARAAAALIPKLKSGSASIVLDDDSQICVAITKQAQKLVFDFGGTSKQHTGNYNATTAIVRAAVVYCLRVLLGQNIPLNDGLLKSVRLIILRGSCLNPAPTAAVAAGNVEVSQAIVDAIFAALGVCAGGQGTCNNLTIGIGGKQYYETICGGMGASKGMRGGSAVQVHMTNSRATDPEILESHYPLRLETFAIARNSGGRGATNGGDGVRRVIRFLEAGEANLLTSHRRHPPRGINGGKDGKCGQNQVQRQATNKTETITETLAARAQTKLNAGDRLIITTPSGAAYGKK